MSSEQVLIHVRFSPDGTVTEIGERPAVIPAQAWFNLLTEEAGSTYQALSGGRALFRLPRDTVDALKLGAMY